MKKNQYMKPAISMMEAEMSLPISNSLIIKNEAQNNIVGDVKANEWGLWEDILVEE